MEDAADVNGGPMLYDPFHLMNLPKIPKRYRLVPYNPSTLVGEGWRWNERDLSIWCPASYSVGCVMRPHVYYIRPASIEDLSEYFSQFMDQLS